MRLSKNHLLSTDGFLSFFLCLSYTQGTRYSNYASKQLVRLTFIEINLRNTSQDFDLTGKIYFKFYS